MILRPLGHGSGHAEDTRSFIFLRHFLRDPRLCEHTRFLHRAEDTVHLFFGHRPEGDSEGVCWFLSLRVLIEGWTPSAICSRQCSMMPGKVRPTNSAFLTPLYSKSSGSPALFHALCRSLSNLLLGLPTEIGIQRELRISRAKKGVLTHTNTSG